MNTLDRILELREERHWTEYKLAEKSGITQSTISTWYRKNIQPTIPSLQKICNAFGITLSQFFLEDDNNTLVLTSQQLRLLKYASKLTPEQYECLISFLESL
ncbi:MAG: helix-turn-helix domain-containing protein [Wujia sp.]